MNALALMLFVILAIVAGFHFYWALGGLWPGKDETSLARTVVGAKGITKMPPAGLTLFVAIAIAIVALWPLMLRGLIPSPINGPLLRFCMTMLMGMFIGRGIASYVPLAQKKYCEQPFARLNRLYFSPLCLIIGAGFILLLFNA